MEFDASFRWILFLFMMACNQKVKKLNEAPNIPVTGAVTAGTAKEQKTDSLSATYRLYLKGLDETQVNNVKAAYLNYKWVFAGKTSAECDSGYALFESFYMQVYNRANESPVPHFANSKRLQEFKDSLKSYGFELAQQEGEWYYKQNRDFIATHFYTSVSPAMKEYLEQMLEESKAPYASEGGLNIEPNELVDRFIWWNQFCKNNKNFLLKTFSDEKAITYGTVIISGIENAPLFSGKDEQLTSYYKDAYMYLLNNYKDVDFVKKFEGYYQSLLKKDDMEISAFLARWLPYETPYDKE
jgi:hypothetical protein